MRTIKQSGTLAGAPEKPFYPTATPQGLSDFEATVGTALRPFWNALANRAAAPVDVVAMGHSYVEGVYSTSVNSTFTSLFRDALRARFQPAGVAGGFGFKTRTIVSHFTDDFLTVAGGTNNSGYGLGRKSMMLNGAGQTYTYTGVSMTGFDILYVGYSGGGTGYYTIDGGAPVTFSTSNATIRDGMRVQVRGLSAGTHTIVVGWSSGANVFMCGMMIYNGDESKGIRMWENAQSSTQTAWWTDTANARWLDNINTIQPSLVVITDMVNDYSGSSAPLSSRTTHANLRYIIDNIRAQCTNPPTIVICAEFQRATSTIPIEPWANYVNVAKAIAANDPGVLVWDMGARFGAGPFAAGTPLVNADRIHPTNAGMQLWADSLAAFVSPR